MCSGGLSIGSRARDAVERDRASDGVTTAELSSVLGVVAGNNDTCDALLVMPFMACR